MTEFVSYSKSFSCNMLNQAWNSNFTALASAPKDWTHTSSVCPVIWWNQSLLHSAVVFLLWFFWLHICSVLFIPVLCYPQAMRVSLLPMDWMYFYWVSLPSLSLEPSSVSSLLLSPSQFGAPVQSSRLEYFILLLISQVFLTESYLWCFVIIWFSTLDHLMARISSQGLICGLIVWLPSLLWI